MLTKTLLFLLCLPWSIFAPVEVNQIGGTLISTKYGQLRGVSVHLPGLNLEKVEAFRGIKFGTLNTTLRFAHASTKFSNWNGTQIAKNYQAICFHKVLNDNGLKHLLKFLPKEFLRKLYGKMKNYTTSQSEECLTLNVHMPPVGEYDTCGMCTA